MNDDSDSRSHPLPDGFDTTEMEFRLFEGRFDEFFRSMTIPGESGIAVAWETMAEQLCWSVGRTDGVCRKMLLEGEPFQPFQLIRTTPVTLGEYDRFRSQVDEIPARNGIVSADVLDGEGFWLRWVEPGSEMRLILFNPCQLESEFYQHLGRNLGRLFQRARLERRAVRTIRSITRWFGLRDKAPEAGDH